LGDRTAPVFAMSWQRTLGEMEFHKTVLALGDCAVCKRR